MIICEKQGSNSNNCIIIRLSDKSLYLNEEKYDLSLFGKTKEQFAYLIELLRRKEAENRLFSVDECDSDYGLMILLGLTILNNVFIFNDDYFELSFAYAVPLGRDEFLKKFTMDNLSDCFGTHNIVFLKSDSLYIKAHLDEDGLGRLCKKNKKTILLNKDVAIEQVPFTDRFFQFWEKYDYERFNEVQTESFKNFFKNVYTSTSAFRLYQYSKNGEVFAYNVLYFSENQKIIYDVLLPWLKKKEIFRVGIYSAIYNLKLAADLNWGYSLCYGKFPYKDQIWKYL